MNIFFYNFSISLSLNIFRIIKAYQSDSEMQNQIYNYLEKVLPYNKKQLMNEIKEFAIRKCENDVRTLERNLQKEINQIMPGVKEKYDIEVKKIEEQKAAYQGTDKHEHKFRNPPRKFPWTDNLSSRFEFDLLFVLKLC